MATIPTITNISAATNANTNWSPTSIRTSTIDQTNPAYVRIFRLDGGFLTLARGAYVAGMELTAIVPQLLALVPQLTWPPIITAQPANISNQAPNNAASFAITATSEIAISYQWQSQAYGGSNYTNVSNGGVYSNATTNTLNISNGSGLSGYQFLCLAINNSGTTTSNFATLITDPAILSYTPSSKTLAVVHPAAGAFSITISNNSAASFQWQLSTGGSYSNITTAGAANYANYTTASLSIGTTNTGMNNYSYKCLVTDSSGSLLSAAFTLNVT